MTEIFLIFLIVIFLFILLKAVFFRKRSRDKNISNYIRPDMPGNLEINNVSGDKKYAKSKIQKRPIFRTDPLSQQKRMRDQGEEQIKRQRQMQDRAAEQLRQQNKTQEFLQHQRKLRERIAQQQQDVLNRVRRNNWNK